MNTSNFKQEVLNFIKDEGFGMTNSGRAQGHDMKYDLDKLFEVQGLKSDMTLKELVLEVIEDSKIMGYDPGFMFARKMQDLGSVTYVYASEE